MKDVSIGPEPRTSLTHNGWPEHKVGELHSALNGKITGVTKVVSAGGSTSAYIYFDPKVTTAEDVDRAAIKVANDVLPGHDFT